MNLFVDPEARIEFRAAALYYETARGGLGQRLVDAVEAAFQRIRERPRLYRCIKGRFRRCMVERFPFGIIYAIETDQIYVAAVMHMHRRPGYWLRRSRRR